MFKHFKVMWRHSARIEGVYNLSLWPGLVNGLVSAGQTIISTTILIIVSLFIFACMAVELISKVFWCLRLVDLRARTMRSWTTRRLLPL